MKTDPLKWWESLDEPTQVELMERYCPHWDSVIDVTDNDWLKNFEL